MQHWSGEGNLQHIAARTLVVWGDKDRSYQWSQIEQLWQTIPGCSLSVVPDCAHAVHAEFPDALNRIVDRFLSEG